MGSMNNFNTAAGALGAVKTMKSAEETTDLLQRLLWEQRQTNLMLWSTLSDSQKAEVTAASAAISAAESEDGDGGRKKRFRR
jgi:hypothetical protein